MNSEGVVHNRGIGRKLPKLPLSKRSTALLVSECNMIYCAEMKAHTLWVYVLMCVLVVV